jgi:hypothetical protein
MSKTKKELVKRSIEIEGLGITLALSKATGVSKVQCMRVLIEG